MKTGFILFLVVAMTLTLFGFGCGNAVNPGAGSDSIYSVSFTPEGTDYSYSSGPNESGGVPRIVIDSSGPTTRIQASDAPFTYATETPNEALYLNYDYSITRTGTYREDSIASVHFLNDSMDVYFGLLPDSYIEIVITEYGSDVVKGTSSGVGTSSEVLENGTFTVKNAGTM